METTTVDCAGCGHELAEDAAQFTCTGCDEMFCLRHLVKYDGEEACPMCAEFWAQDAKRKLVRMFEENVAARLTRRAS